MMRRGGTLLVTPNIHWVQRGRPGNEATHHSNGTRRLSPIPSLTQNARRRGTFSSDLSPLLKQRRHDPLQCQQQPIPLKMRDRDDTTHHGAGINATPLPRTKCETEGCIFLQDDRGAGITTTPPPSHETRDRGFSFLFI